MTNIVSRSSLVSIGAALALATALSLTVGTLAAHAAISSSLDFGATGPQVIELQTYLATNTSIYPEGLVTGYFGPLTQRAVQRFQTAQGIVSSGTPATTGYGRVGPLTAARINALMGSGSNVSWDTVPIMSSIAVQVTNSSVSYSWSTNEVTQGQVYWSTSPIIANEATGPNQQPYVSGTLAVDSEGLRTNHNVTITGLQSNTTYYYLVRVADNGGNVTMMWPPASFRTN